MSWSSALQEMCRNGLELWFENGRLLYRLPDDGQAPAEWLGELRNRRSELLEYYAGKPGLIGPYRPSQAQLAMYIVGHLRPGFAGYVLRYPLLCAADIDQERLQRALDGLAWRHRMLNARFLKLGDQLQMFFRAKPELKLSVDIVDDMRPDSVQRWIESHSTTQMDLESGPLCRWHLALERQGGSHAMLMVIAHHMVADHRSLEIIWRDLRWIYAADRSVSGSGKAEELTLPAGGCGLADLAELPHWQASRPQVQQDTAYWREQLQQVPPPLRLGEELPNARQTGSGHEFRQRLDSELRDDITAIAGQQRVTDFMVMLVVYGALLAARNQDAALCVGVSTEGRSAHPGRDLVGCFVNTVPVQIKSDLPEYSLNTAIEQLNLPVREAINHAGVAFMEQVKLARLERPAQRPVLFQTLFSWLSVRHEDNASAANPSMGLQAFTPQQPSRAGVTHDIVLAVHDLPGQRYCHWSVDAGVYALPVIQRLADDYVHLLQAAAADPEAPLRTLLRMPAEAGGERERFEL